MTDNPIIRQVEARLHTTFDRGYIEGAEAVIAILRKSGASTEGPYSIFLLGIADDIETKFLAKIKENVS